MNINKTKIISFRLQEFDFEFIRKRAGQLRMRPSDYIRNLVKKHIKNYIKRGLK